ncbi:MAG TPA: response regulator transcription factor [Patescibacteria group bacterium]|nr:response regulator transcription factor [Patescibacteria group bacterium]
MRVLVVEDEHKIAASIKKGLEQENFTVDLAHTAERGIDLALGEEYDIIVLDRLLPGMEGVEIVKTIRDEQIHTPILLLTAKGQVEDRVEGLNAGADDYMVKPFAFSELIARIRALARRPQKSNGQVLLVDDLKLDTQNFEVERAGKKISLSSKEFSLLEYLMQHANKILSKDQIISHIWNYDADVLPNSVEVYIKHLRDKVDKGFDTSLIHTIRGFGYKIGK